MASIPEEPNIDVAGNPLPATASLQGLTTSSNSPTAAPAISNNAKNVNILDAADIEAQEKKKAYPWYRRLPAYLSLLGSSLLGYIVEHERLVHWCWALGVVAIVLYTVQLVAPAVTAYYQKNDPGYLQPAPFWLQLASSYFFKILAYSVVILGTVVCALLDQEVNRAILKGHRSSSEFIILAFVLLCFVAGWILWGFRHHDYYYEIVSSYLFDLNEVVLMLRFAYQARCLVANRERSPVRDSGAWEMMTHPDLPATRPVHHSPESDHASHQQRSVDSPEPEYPQQSSSSRTTASTDTLSVLVKQMDITT